MTLPDPTDVKRLMSVMSDKVSDVVVRLRVLAAEYGVHGRILTYGEFSFQLTRINERWSVYISSASGPLRDLEGSKLDEKLLFLEHVEEFEEDYLKRIRDLYGKLKKMADKLEG